MWSTTSSARRRRFARAAFLLLWLSVSLTVSSGCGGSDEPGLPRATAEALAERSDIVADALARGDRCEADHQADLLVGQTADAINAGRVPARFQEEVLSAANDLAAAIDCPPPPQPVVEEEDEDEDGRRSKGKKGNGKGKKGDDD